MFEQAKSNAPCIIFIDEIDAVGRHRGAGLGGGNDEREQTLNQLLVEMDGFEANESIILIAATNRPDVLDPALLRPGRFDRQVVVPNPDIIGREKILKVHMKKTPLASDVEARTIARGTPGFSGADLANLVNEAALLAARRAKRLVSMQEFEDAKDKVMMGAERRSMVMTEEEKRLTAYHEGGHALVALNMEASDPVHKATIIPRGRALGMVMRLPERDQLSVTRAKMKADLAVAMGGRIAEELIFGHEKVTSGASSDIQMATNMAKAMVTQYGMSEEMGPLAYGENEQEVFLGHSVARQQNMSEETQCKIDAEVRRLVEEGYEQAKTICQEKMDDLHTIAKGLLEYETLTGDEITGLLNGTPPERNDTDNSPGAGGPASPFPKVGGAGGQFGGPEPQGTLTVQRSMTAHRPHIFGIVNITEDSFSDGGQFLNPEAAIAHAADLFAAVQMCLISGRLPAIRMRAMFLPTKKSSACLPFGRVCVQWGAALSVDSFQPETQKWALAQGADWLNDINGFCDPQMHEFLADASCSLVVMHAIQAKGIATRPRRPTATFGSIFWLFSMRGLKP